jgi:general nucleoside transport system permease protein
MKKDVNRRFRLSALSSLTSSLIAIVAGLVVGFIVLLITNPSQAPGGFLTIFLGGFTGGAQGIGNVFYLATPIIMTGLSVAFAFKTGLFNIGASGQLIVGGYVAVLIGVTMPGLGEGQWIVAILGAMVAGALWAFIPGLLKAYFNVHEVISCIMMNYIGMYAVNGLVAETVYDSLKNQSMPVKQTALLPSFGLDQVFKGSSINCGIIIAIFFVIVLYIVLNKTVFGYELKACGFNRDASRYAGINARKNIVLSMVIAGAMAGVAGALMYLSRSGKYIEVVDVLVNEGFMGIPVALLGLSNPIGVLFAGLFISYIYSGGFYLQLYNFVPQIIDIIISIIIYFSAFALIVKNFFDRYRLRSVKKPKPDENGIITGNSSDKGGT